MRLHDNVVQPLLDWLASLPLPPFVSSLHSHFLGSGDSLSFSVEQAPVILQPFISGAFTAQLKFSVRFRTITDSSDQRSLAMDALDRFAHAAESSLPALKGGFLPLSTARCAPVVLENRNANGSEVFLVPFVLTFYAPAGLP